MCVFEKLRVARGGRERRRGKEREAAMWGGAGGGVSRAFIMQQQINNFVPGVAARSARRSRLQQQTFFAEHCQCAARKLRHTRSCGLRLGSALNGDALSARGEVGARRGLAYGGIVCRRSVRGEVVARTFE